jgi:tetratricopeptide (TPR) repeat protein
VGRIDEITKLEEWTMQPDGARRVALCGLGGVGKTQIVLELVYRIKDMDPERSIFWIPCTSHESVEQAYMDIAQLVGIQNMKPREIKGHVVAHFSQKSTGKWLFIFDGADDMDIWIQGSNTRPGLTEYLPYNEHGHLIFTSRNQKLAVKLASSHVMAISEPDEETSVVMFKALLIHRPIDMHVAMTIVKKLAFLPLAIAQAASYINETSCGISDYIDLLKAEELEVVELLNERFEDEGRYRNSESAVITTWSISFQQIQRSNQLAVDYLSFMACINPVNIPLSLLPQSASKKKMIDAIGLLKAYFFVREHSSLYLHPLVHLATRNWMRQNHLLNLSIHKAAHRLYEIFPDNDYTNRPLWRQYLHHALFFVQRNAFSDDNEQYVSFLWRVGKCLKSDGKYSEAGVVFGDIMRIQERTNGEMHSSTPISLTWLASTYNDQGRLQEALELNTRAMAISKRIFSAEHPDRLIVTANLASTYQAQGQLEKAIELNMQVMDIRVMVLGMEHPDTLNTMANLASIYREQGRLEEALELNTRAMAISKRIFSAEHPDRLIVTANLASTYQAQGQLEKAIELNMQVMDIRMRVLGREHPDTLNTMANLASIYREQGRLDGAAELDTRVIDYKRESAWN